MQKCDFNKVAKQLNPYQVNISSFLFISFKQSHNKKQSFRWYLRKCHLKRAKII